jgi:hypothetical protein
MSFALGLRLRFLAVVVILAAAALAAGLMTLSRLRKSTSERPAAPAPSKAGKPHSVKPLPRPPAAAPAAPVKPLPHSAADGASATPGLPPEVSRQLAANRVVVVSLYAPKAKVDSTAMREAAAGAALSGAAFVSVDVTGSEIDGLNRRYGVLQDPAVLVLRPPGELIVRIDGFADRDTVAQAAANAAS